jgi:hypothetical protein
MKNLYISSYELLFIILDESSFTARTINPIKNYEHLGPVYRSEINLIVIKCEINRTRDQIAPIEVSDSWVNRALKFNSN